MLPPLKAGVTLAQPDGPIIETERLKLRPWCSADVAPNTAMLSDPGTARFIAADGKPVTTELAGWRNAAVMAGHWALHGAGHVCGRGKIQRKLRRARWTLVSAGLAGL